MASRGRDDRGTLRIVMMGKTGAGKSSLGNVLLLGKKAPKVNPDDVRDQKPSETKKDPFTGFKVGRGLGSSTIFCNWDLAKCYGITLEVTDTPGLCDTELPEKVIYKEVAKSVAVAEPGPNVILFALRCHRRFTNEEYQAYQKIRELFSPEMDSFLILVFNGLDNFEEEETIEEQRAALDAEVKKFGSPLKDIIRHAGGRYFGMNKASPKDKETQDLVRSNGRNACYKTSMTEKINKKVEAMTEKEATKRGVSQHQAADQVKRDIVEENVSPGFLETLGGYIYEGASKVVGGVKHKVNQSTEKYLEANQRDITSAAPLLTSTGTGNEEDPSKSGETVQ